MHDEYQSVSCSFSFLLLRAHTAMKTQKTKTDTYDAQTNPAVLTLYPLGFMGKGRGGI